MGSAAMFETPGPPLESTIALTAGTDWSACGVSSNAIGIVGLAGSARSSGTATVPHRAFAAAVAPHSPNTAVGTAAAVLGNPSAAMAASSPNTPLRPIMAANVHPAAAPRPRGGGQPPSAI